MSEKDSTSKILKMHPQERKLLIEHLGSRNALADCVIQGDFCEKAC